MNYIKEMNAFYDWLETNELSPSAINVWYALLHINNKAGWAQSFAVAESVLHVKTGLSDRTIRKARAELKDKNRIHCESRSGGRAPLYTMIPFHPADVRTTDRTTEKSADVAKPSPPTSPGLLKAFVASFHDQPSPAQIQLLASYMEQNGMSEDLVIWALNDTRQRGKPFEYVRSMLNRMAEKNICTVEAAITARKEYKARMQQQTKTGNIRPFHKNRSGSPVPDWVGDPQQSLQTFQPTDEQENRHWLEGLLEGM
ncbi:DnaD domain protein [Fictibacillus iocasae]|uniref:DnaD domain protein n=1 Tax=Fictibacillus iocasae TaxID=2715437 RepID=A0ABW2NMV1_9BACL